MNTNTVTGGKKGITGKMGTFTNLRLFQGPLSIQEQKRLCLNKDIFCYIIIIHHYTDRSIFLEKFEFI